VKLSDVRVFMVEDKGWKVGGLVIRERVRVKVFWLVKGGWDGDVKGVR
jgi:hypothetical protein